MEAAPERTKASVWQRPYGARERVIISRQAVFDRRSIPPLWYWRKLLPEDEGGDLGDEVLWETPRVQRRYADPIPVHIYVDWTPQSKKRKKGTTETENVAEVGFSRAEGRRLGFLLSTEDDLEELRSKPGHPDPLFIPRPGDVFRFSDDHFEILQMGPPERYGPTSIPVVWKGKANLYRDDSSAPGGTLPVPPTPQPTQLPEPAPRFAWRG